MVPLVWPILKKHTTEGQYALELNLDESSKPSARSLNSLLPSRVREISSFGMPFHKPCDLDDDGVMGW